MRGLIASSLLPKEFAVTTSFKVGSAEVSKTAMGKRGDELFQEIQKKLLPDHAEEIAAINLTNGEYVLAKSVTEVVDRFRKTWPDDLYFLTRVDGEPLFRLRGLS